MDEPKENANTRSKFNAAHKNANFPTNRDRVLNYSLQMNQTLEKIKK